MHAYAQKQDQLHQSDEALITANKREQHLMEELSIERCLVTDLRSGLTVSKGMLEASNKDLADTKKVCVLYARFCMFNVVTRGFLKACLTVSNGF